MLCPHYTKLGWRISAVLVKTKLWVVFLACTPSSVWPWAEELLEERNTEKTCPVYRKGISCPGHNGWCPGAKFSELCIFWRSKKSHFLALLTCGTNPWMHLCRVFIYEGWSLLNWSATMFSWERLLRFCKATPNSWIMYHASMASVHKTDEGAFPPLLWRHTGSLAECFYG